MLPALGNSHGGGTGEVIGFTTSAVVPHATQLNLLGLAAGQLIADGHTLVPVDDLSQDLSELDRLFVGLVDSRSVLSSEQIDAIEQYVRSGGNLVFLGENNNFFADNNAAVGTRFGVSFPEAGNDPQETVADIVEPHPLTNGPFGEVEALDGGVNQPTFFGSIEDPGPYGRSLIRFERGQHACVVIEPGALNPGSGLVVFLTETNIFIEDYLEADNRAFWRNIFEYDGLIKLDFGTADDFRSLLANGQAIAPGGAFGSLLHVEGLGPHQFGAAVFNSDPAGPNVDGADPDLLVDKGNLLILQENGEQSIPGIFDSPDDALLGGTLQFEFEQPVRLASVDLVDICPNPLPQEVTLVLTDSAGRTRNYDVPTGWTRDVRLDGPPGYRRLDLEVLTPQPGFASIATAAEEPGFNACGVTQLSVEFSSSGGLDDLCLRLSPPNCSTLCLELDPGVDLQSFMGGSGSGRALYLTANEDFSIDTLSWWTNMLESEYEALIYQGQGVFAGLGPVLASGTAVVGGEGLAWYEIPIDFEFEAGSDDVVSWRPAAPFPGWLPNPQPFFDWGDPVEDDVLLGPVTIRDGREGFIPETWTNFVAPFFRLRQGGSACSPNPAIETVPTSAPRSASPPGVRQSAETYRPGSTPSDGQ